MERFNSLSDTYYRNASAVVYVYSRDNRGSFLQLSNIEEKLSILYEKDEKGISKDLHITFIIH